MAAISKHLSVLESAGLIHRRVVGRNRICSLSPKALDEAAEWLEHYRSFWNEQLDSLEEMLQAEVAEHENR